MAIEKIALDNVKRVVDNETADVVVTMDPATAVAYEESKAAAERAEEVTKELEERLPAQILEVKSEDTPVENMYTKKLVLDESIDDFNMPLNDTKKRSNDDEDRYVEFDMFDFIYSLFSSETDSLIRPLKALSNSKGRGRKKAGETGSAFMYQGSDDYIDETGEKGVEGVAQISTDNDGNVVLYQDTKESFDPVVALCDEYGFDYEGPIAKKAPWVRWNYSFIVHVPTYADGYPMEVEDYFDKQGIAIEDVMPPEFIKGRAKDYKKMNDEVVVETTFKKFVRLAGNSNDPLEGFIKDMFRELDDQGVKYDRKSLKDRFFDEFNDDFEDED